MRGSFVWLVGLSVSVALGLSWLASSPARSWMLAVTYKGNLFAAALMSELFVAMMALAVSARLPWRGHTAGIAKGLGAYSLLTVLIETGHSYFGRSRELPVFVIFSDIRMAAYLCCVTYWIIDLWRDEVAWPHNDARNARKDIYIACTAGIRSSGLAITKQIVNTHSLYFVAAMGMFFVALISIAVYYYARGRRSSQARWEELLAQLARIDRDNIAQVALDLVDESGRPKQSEDAASLEPWQLWRLIGGLEGLELLEANSEVLIDMAFYVQQWYPEAIVIAERLRLDARET